MCCMSLSLHHLCLITSLHVAHRELRDSSTAENSVTSPVQPQVWGSCSPLLAASHRSKLQEMTKFRRCVCSFRTESLTFLRCPTFMALFLPTFSAVILELTMLLTLLTFLFGCFYLPDPSILKSTLQPRLWIHKHSWSNKTAKKLP